MLIERVTDKHEWALMMPMLSVALAYSPFENDSVANTMRALYAGDGIVLKIVDDDRVIGACMLELIPYDLKQAVNIWALTADRMDEWIDDLLVVIEEIAQDNNTDVLVMGGRVGWQPVLKKLGFYTRSVIMEKRLGE